MTFARRPWRGATNERAARRTSPHGSTHTHEEEEVAIKTEEQRQSEEGHDGQPKGLGEGGESWWRRVRSGQRAAPGFTPGGRLQAHDHTDR